MKVEVITTYLKAFGRAYRGLVRRCALRSGMLVLPIRMLESVDSESQLPFLVVCSYLDIRTGAPANAESMHPLCTAAEYIAHRSDSLEAKRVLKVFYENVQFKTWGEFLGEECNEFNKALEFSPLAEVWPWSSNINEVTVSQNHKRAITREFRNYGIISEGDYSFYFGPASDRKIAWELDRLRKSIESIKKHGYLRHNKTDGDIAGWILIHNGNRVIHVHSGLHRLAALWGLGYKNIIVRVDGIYDSKDLATWKAVKNGLYSRKLVIGIFNRIFLPSRAN